MISKMNVDDIDFEQEWENFKDKVQDKPFSFYEVAAFWYENHMQGQKQRTMTYKLDNKMFYIWVKLGLVISQSTTTDARFRFWRINPKELCSMSNPSIQSDEK